MAPTDTLLAQDSQRGIPRLLLIAVGLLLAVRIGLHFVPEKNAVDESGSRVKWVEMTEATRRAEITRKPILYEFSAAWCGPCRVLERDAFANEKIAAAINERFIPVRVIDRQQEDGANTPEVETLQRRFSVRVFPTLVASRADGTALGRMEGYSGRAPFEQFLDDASRER